MWVTSGELRVASQELASCGSPNVGVGSHTDPVGCGGANVGAVREPPVRGVDVRCICRGGTCPSRSLEKKHDDDDSCCEFQSVCRGGPPRPPAPCGWVGISVGEMACLAATSTASIPSIVGVGQPDGGRTRRSAPTQERRGGWYQGICRGGNCGRLAIGQRAGHVPPANHGLHPDPGGHAQRAPTGTTRNAQQRTWWPGVFRAKKGGRGGSFPSPKGEEDRVEDCFTTLDTQHPHPPQVLAGMLIACDYHVKGQSVTHEISRARQCHCREKGGAREEAPLSSPAAGGKKGSALSAVENKHPADRSGRMTENGHVVNSYTTIRREKWHPIFRC